MTTPTPLTPATTLESLFVQRLLSQRAYNCLTRANMLTLGDVIKYVQEGNNLRDLPKFGLASEVQVKKVLQSYDKADVIGVSKESFVKTYDELDKDIMKILTEVFDNMAGSEDAQDNEGVIGYFFFKYPDARSFFNTLVKGKETVFLLQPYLYTQENIEYRRYHITVLDQVLRLMEDRGMAGHPQYFQFSHIVNVLKNGYEDFNILQVLEHYLTQQTDKHLQQSYENLATAHLTPRVLSFLQTALPTYWDAIKYFDKPVEDYSKLCPGRSMFKTLEDIYEFVQRFRALEFSRLERFIDDDELLTNHIKKDYSFLKIDQCEFVKDFIRRYKVRPFFYLAFNRILTSRTKECRCFRMYHGLNEDGQQHTIEEVVHNTSYTRDRMRRILESRYDILGYFSMTNEEKAYYKKVFDCKVIPEDSEMFVDFVARERLPYDFRIFSVMCSLLMDYKMEEALGYRVLIGRGVSLYPSFNKIIEKFLKAYNARYGKRTFFSYGRFVPYLSLDYYKDISVLFQFLSRDRLNNITFTNKGIFLGEDRLDVASILYDILQGAREPLTLQELFDQFKELHPDHKIWKPDQLNYYITRSDKIKTIGKESRFGTASWVDEYFDSMTNHLVEALQLSDMPLNIEELFSLIRPHFPSTNVKTITYVIQEDSLKRFVQFEKGYVGLSGKEYPNQLEPISEDNPQANKKRKAFQEKIQKLTTFIQTNQRFPFSKGDNEEKFLYNWIRDASQGRRNITQEEKETLTELIEHFTNAGYPRTQLELDFLTKCNEYKQYVQDNHIMPSWDNNWRLNQWFYWIKTHYFKDFEDQRRKYFIDLCDYLKAQGYDVNL